MNIKISLDGCGLEIKSEKKHFDRFKTVIDKNYLIKIYCHVRFFGFLIRQLSKHVNVLSHEKEDGRAEIVCHAKTLRDCAHMKRILRDWIGPKKFVVEEMSIPPAPPT